MPGELVQTVVNAALLLIVAFVGGTLGVRRFEAIERSIGELRAEMTGLRTELKSEIGELRTEMTGLRTELKSEIGELRTELKSEIGELRTELKSEIGELRTEFAQMRSDLTHVALAVGARPAQG